jgi:hypothetical protein
VRKRRACTKLPVKRLAYFRFLLANFQLIFVLRETDQGSMREALKSLPSCESEAYEQVMTRIRATKYTSEKALGTLSWIFHAQRPLQMDELREALVLQSQNDTVDLDEKALGDLSAQISSNLVKALLFTRNPGEPFDLATPRCGNSLSPRSLRNPPSCQSLSWRRLV